MEALQLNTDNILDLVDGDMEYLQELIALYRDFLKEFPINYQDTLSQGDVVEFKLLMHKAKPSLRFLGMDLVEEEGKILKEILAQNALSKKRERESIRKIVQTCQFFDHELAQFLKQNS